MLEQDYSFPCPYCGVTLSVRLDVTGGRKQALVYDCEICCRPIQIQVEFEGENIASFSANLAD